MTLATRRDLAILAVVVLLIGWVVSVGIRSWQGVHVEVAAEMMGAALACSALYRGVTGKSDNGGDS